ncbi:MAG: hypothetical protein IT364_24635 [Candidatus Hydrogenedentes bacterium]|nr:hypothetical protein [Candidatus Hydrogenedentota bacterium]
MGKYGVDTSVSVERSIAEIQSTLQRYGADGFLHGWKGETAMVQFEMCERRVRFQLTMPDRDDREFTHTEARGRPRSASQALAAWEQACRQRYRALALVIKAKLEAVESGITEFEDEFLAHIVLADGSQVRDHVRSAIEASYSNGKMLPLLPGVK